MEAIKRKEANIKRITQVIKINPDLRKHQDRMLSDPRGYPSPEHSERYIHFSENMRHQSISKTPSTSKNVIKSPKHSNIAENDDLNLSLKSIKESVASSTFDKPKRIHENLKSNISKPMALSKTKFSSLPKNEKIEKKNRLDLKNFFRVMSNANTNLINIDTSRQHHNLSPNKFSRKKLSITTSRPELGTNNYLPNFVGSECNYLIGVHTRTKTVLERNQNLPEIKLPSLTDMRMNFKRCVQKSKQLSEHSN